MVEKAKILTKQQVEKLRQSRPFPVERQIVKFQLLLLVLLVAATALMRGLSTDVLAVSAGGLAVILPAALMAVKIGGSRQSAEQRVMNFFIWNLSKQFLTLLMLGCLVVFGREWLSIYAIMVGFLALACSYWLVLWLPRWISKF